MKHDTIKALVLLAMLASLPATARDITHEQQEAYDARLRVEEANSDYEDAVKEVEHQNIVVGREQTKLKELQDKQVTAKKALESAQADKEAKDKILNEAWEQRDK